MAGRTAQNETSFNVSSSSYNKINCLPVRRAFLHHPMHQSSMVNGDWRSSAPINSGFLLQVYRLCKPPSASVMQGLQQRAHDERWSSVLRQAASGSTGISSMRKLKCKCREQRLDNDMCTWWQRSTGLEQPSSAGELWTAPASGVGSVCVGISNTIWWTTTKTDEDAIIVWPRWAQEANGWGTTM